MWISGKLISVAMNLSMIWSARGNLFSFQNFYWGSISSKTESLTSLLLPSPSRFGARMMGQVPCKCVAGFILLGPAGSFFILFLTDEKRESRRNESSWIITLISKPGILILLVFLLFSSYAGEEWVCYTHPASRKASWLGKRQCYWADDVLLPWAHFMMSFEPRAMSSTLPLPPQTKRRQMLATFFPYRALDELWWHKYGACFPLSLSTLFPFLPLLTSIVGQSVPSVATEEKSLLWLSIGLSLWVILMPFRTVC